MRVTVEEYENTPALTVDWDLEFAQVEDRVNAARAEKAKRGR